MEKKSQHYVPEFYLRNFVDENSKHLPNPYLWIFERDKPFKPYRKAPENVACESNYYSLSDDDEMLRILIEDEFQRLESCTATVVRKIISSDKVNLTIEERAVLSEFIVYMDTRVPNFRNSHDQAQKDLFKLIIEMSTLDENIIKSIAKKHELETGKRISTHEIKKLMLSDNYEIKIPKQSSLRSMVKVTPELIEYPFKMCWEFLIAPKDVYFITSDNPIILTVPKRQPSFYGVGFLTKKVHLLFPLSPNICLLARWKSGNNYRYKQVSSEMVRWVNEEISSYSTNFVFASSNKFYLPGRVLGVR